MTIQEVADEVYRDLGSPSGISVPVIAFWLRGHIGDLNILLFTDYALNDYANDFTPELGEEEKSILKKLYIVHYYDLKIRETLGAAAVDSLLEVTSDGATIRTINKNELSKTYLSLKRDEEISLKDLVVGYANKAVSPLQVAGTDTITDANNILDDVIRRVT